MTDSFYDFDDDVSYQKPNLEKTLESLKSGRYVDAFYGLSDLTNHETKQVKPIWETISVVQRRKFLKQLIEFSEKDFTLNYQGFGLMALSDSDPQVRASAIELLWEDESLEILHLLHDITRKDSDPHVRATAISGLGRFVLLGEYEEIPEAEIMPIQKTLVDLWEDNNQPVEVRRRALESIANSQHPIVPNAIKDAYQSDNNALRTSAIFAMGRTCDNKWEDIVLAELESDDPEILFEAVRASGELTIVEAVRMLAKVALEEDRDIQEMAIWSLGEIGTKEAVRTLNLLAERAEEEDDDDLLESIEDAISMATLVGDDSHFTVDLDHDED